MTFFTEVRLQASVQCRAWTAEQGCFSALEWERKLGTLSPIRLFFEHARLRISEKLGVGGIDPLGIVRRLLIHESSASLSRAGLREVGFVHLDAASGIHLYALWRAYEFALARIAPRLEWNPRWTGLLRTVVPLGLWALVFGLAGFRPGLCRPLVLVLARWTSARFGFRWARAAPILIALGFDAFLGLLYSFGTAHAFAEWAPGELHYAAAWWGGILGYDFARARGFGGFRSHFALSVASWLAVLPLDLASGHFAPVTPLLSLLTIEVLVRGGYLLLVLGALGVGFGNLVGAACGLQWMAFLVNDGVGALARFLIEKGCLRTLPEGLGEPFALMAGVWISGLAIGVYRSQFGAEHYCSVL
jgi:hypothetical protein